MSGGSIERNVRITESVDMDSLLADIEIMVRHKAVKKAIKAACHVVAREYRRRIPRGDPGHNPGKKPLHKTVRTRVRDYGHVTLGIVGTEWPEGAHAHLIEDGHKVVVSRGTRKGQSPLSGKTTVEGKRPLAAAIDTTMAAQDHAVIKSLQEDIKASGG